jgi:hypothetical protein
MLGTRTREVDYGDCLGTHIGKALEAVKLKYVPKKSTGTTLNANQYCL